MKTILNVIHTSAVVSNYATFGGGNFIASNVTINTFAKIADNCILNTGCILEHECLIANGVHIAPRTVLAGNVMVGENSFIGPTQWSDKALKLEKM